MKKSILIIIAFVAASTVFAQQSSQNIVFNTTHHNFGTIKEVNGLASFVFEFTNKGNKPVIISNVESSCGCTTPTWSRAAVPPNSKGQITASFDPKDRPGNFDKEITITFNDGKMSKLRISGDVIAKDKKIEDIYKFTIGDLRLISNKLPFAKIKRSETRTEHLEIANTSKQNIQLTFKNVPQHLSIKQDPAILKPNSTGSITVTYNAKKKQGTGFLKDNIGVLVNGKELENNTIQISATLAE